MSQSTPAPKSDQIKGSDKNKAGSASKGNTGIEVNDAPRTSLLKKVADHNEANPGADKRATLGALLAVWRRGAGAYSTSHRPGVSRAAWAMARVNAYLYLLRTGRPRDSKYVTDNDLLPSKHPRRSSKREWVGVPDYDFFVEEEGYKVPAGVSSAAKRAQKWVSDGKAGSGFTDVGRARMAQLARGGRVSRDTVVKMRAFFARHSKSSKGAEGFRSGQDGYPSPGRVAWDAWGGDAGESWVNGLALDD
jgi:hypothetical protein